MSWWMRVPTRARAARHRRRIGQRLQEVAAHHPEDVERAAVGRVHHLGRGQPLEGRAAGSPRPAAKRRAVRLLQPRRAAHLGAALHAGVPADRHDPDLLAAHPAAGQADVHQGLDGVDAVGVLGQAHRPDEDPVPRVAQHAPRSGASPRAWRRSPPPGAPSPAPRRGRAPPRSPRCARAMKALVDPALGHQHLEHAVQEGEVAAGVDGEPLVGELRAEHRRLRHRRHPVALEAGLEVGVDHRHLRALLARVVEVLHRDRLVVRRCSSRRTR